MSHQDAAQHAVANQATDEVANEASNQRGEQTIEPDLKQLLSCFNRDAKPVAWILYDDDCGFCRQWAEFWRKPLSRYGFGFERLQAPWVVKVLPVTQERLLDDIRLWQVQPQVVSEEAPFQPCDLSDERMVSGAAAYRFVLKRVWWLWPIYVLSVLPGLKWGFDRFYRRFADGRGRFSRACGFERQT